MCHNFVFFQNVQSDGTKTQSEASLKNISKSSGRLQNKRLMRSPQINNYERLKHPLMCSRLKNIADSQEPQNTQERN